MWLIVIISGLVAGILDWDWPPAEAFLLLCWLSLALWRAGNRAWSALILSYLFSSLHLAFHLTNTFPAVLSGTDLIIRGEVEQQLSVSERQSRWLVQLHTCRIRQTLEPCQFTGRVRLNLYQRSERKASGGGAASLPGQTVSSRQTFSPGQVIEAQIRLFPVRGYLNGQPGLYRMKQWGQGIYARGYIRTLLSAGAPRSIDGQREKASKEVDRIRAWQQQGQAILAQRADQLAQRADQLAQRAGQLAQRAGQLSQRFEDGVEHYDRPSPDGLFQALLLGDKTGLGDAQWQILQDTGTVHLVVISGLHLSVLLMIGLCFSRFLQACGRYDHWLMISFFQLLPLLILTPALLLWPPGVAIQRALLMLGFWLVLTVMLIRPLSWQVLGLAVVALLAWNPFLLFQPGFFYSVVAVFLLLFWGGRRGEPRSRLLRVLSLQWVIFCGLMGLQSLFLNLPGLNSFLANLIAIPLVTLMILPLSLIFVVWPLDSLAALINELIGLFWQWLALCQQWRGFWAGDSIQGGLLFLAAVVLALPGLPGKRIWWLVSMLLLFLRTTDDTTDDEGLFSVDVADVGQGLAVLVTSGSYRLLYDTGPGYRSGFAPIQLSLLPELKKIRDIEGRPPLDRLVISHEDNDHSGGFQVLQGLYTSVLSGQPEPLKSRYRSGLSSTGPVTEPVIEPCYRGQRWQVNQVQFEILSPEKSAYHQRVSDNNRSCVLKISSVRYPRISLLLTGDIDDSVEYRLIRQEGDKLGVAWLMASHHGSKTGSSQPFLDAVAPDGIIYSAGYQNRFGHPAHQVQRRSRLSGIDQYSTSDQGRISLHPVHKNGQWQLSAGSAVSALPLRWLWQRQ